MLDFLAGISNAIVAVFQLLINLISGIVQLVALAFEFVSYITIVLGYLPTPLLAFAGLGISLSVILLLWGVTNGYVIFFLAPGFSFWFLGLLKGCVCD